MNLRNIDLSNLKIGDSRYRFVQPLWSESDSSDTSVLQRSLAANGVLMPLLAHATEADGLHLIDGFQRAQFLQSKGQQTVACQILAAATPVQQILEILLWEQRSWVLTSAIGKVKFIRFAVELGLDEQCLIQQFLPLLDFQPDRRVLKKCLAVSELPIFVLAFCEHKNYTLKRCIQLTRYPKELLMRVFSWNQELNLTASIVEELLDNLQNTMRANDSSMVDFERNSQTQLLFATDMSPADRTKQLRELVRRMRFPVLTQVNDDLHAIAKAMELPKTIRVCWDPLLEEHNVELHIRLTELKDWQKTLTSLQSSTVPAGIKKMLEHL